MRLMSAAVAVADKLINPAYAECVMFTTTGLVIPRLCRFRSNLHAGLNDLLEGSRLLMETIERMLDDPQFGKGDKL